MMPKTKLGKWAGGLLAGFLVFFIALILGRNLAGLQPGTPLIVIVGICAMVTGIAAFVTGAVSLFKFKDRSSVVILAVVFGSLAILIIIMEVVEGIIWRSTH
jgi:fluoride ion exporter CrcB/FEX